LAKVGPLERVDTVSGIDLIGLQEAQQKQQQNIRRGQAASNVFMLLLSAARTKAIYRSIYYHRQQTRLQGAPIKNNPLGKIHYLSYYKRFFHRIYSFHNMDVPMDCYV